MKKRKIVLTCLLCLTALVGYAWDYECMIKDGDSHILFQWNDAGEGKWGTTGSFHVSTLQQNGIYSNHMWGSGGNSSVLETQCISAAG